MLRIVPALAALVIAAPVQAQSMGPTESAAEEALAPFERLVGGRWHIGEDSWQTFEWGLGRRSVTASMYFVTPDGEKRVSELTFAWHPGEGVVKGYGVAIDMGIDFFEYDVRVDGDVFTFDLQAFGPAAPGGPARETWTFTDDDHYEWVLFEGVDSGWERRMAGTFERRR